MKTKDEKKMDSPRWYWGEPSLGMSIEECEKFVQTVPCYEHRNRSDRSLHVFFT